MEPIAENFQKIASFTVDHTKLQKGMYVSRIDGDVVTYDIRMKTPNAGDYLTNGALHTFEHLFATYARNSALSNAVIYVGPMGCRTGFYVLLVGDHDADGFAPILEATLRDLLAADEVPAANEVQCGWGAHHSLEGAQAAARAFLEAREEWGTVTAS